MPRGKKFEAAEKHFLKQKKELDSTIRTQRQLLENAIEARNRIQNQLAMYQKECALLRKENEELKKLKGLSDSDVRTLIKKADSINAVDSLLKMANYL